MNATQTHRRMNSQAALRVGAEFALALAATTSAEALATGYTPIGNVTEVQPSQNVQTADAFDTNRGAIRKVRHDVTQANLEFDVKTNEFTQFGLKMMLGGADAAAFTQTLQAAANADALAFSITPATIGNYYLLTATSARILQLTAIAVATAASGSAVSVTADATTDKISHTAHGFSNGKALVFQAGSMPAGLTAGVTYFVVSSATNDYKLAATPGGAAIDLTTAGTSVTERPALVPGTDYDVDMLTGAIRFLTAQAATVYPIITAPAINSGDVSGFFSFTPGDSFEFDGIGRLLFFDKQGVNNVPIWWEGFSCQVTLKASGALNPNNFSDMTFTILVTDTPGTAYGRQAMADIT